MTESMICLHICLHSHYINDHLSSCIFSSAETNQELIMVQGGIGLLAKTANEAEDPQTLRMVAGAIANLCGNGMQQSLKTCDRYE